MTDVYFELVEAVKTNQTCLLTCIEKATGQPIQVICIVKPSSVPGFETEWIPLARLFGGNPYEELYPPEAAELLLEEVK